MKKLGFRGTFTLDAPYMFLISVAAPLTSHSTYIKIRDLMTIIILDRDTRLPFSRGFTSSRYYKKMIREWVKPEAFYKKRSAV